MSRRLGRRRAGFLRHVLDHVSGGRAGHGRQGHAKVVLDASGITFADSVLLNLLILTHQAADLRVAAPTRQLRRLLRLTAVDSVLKVRATVEEAVTC
ncbi:STAS domain-containing protein [Streptomyces ziwulingensis]